MTATTTPTINEIPRGSIEYVDAPVTLTPEDPDDTLDMTVQIALTDGASEHTWLPATWTGDPDTTRTARTTTPVTFDTATMPGTTYGVYVKLTDNPEAPILHAGYIRIT